MNTIQKIVLGELLLCGGLALIGVYGTIKTMNDRLFTVEKEFVNFVEDDLERYELTNKHIEQLGGWIVEIRKDMIR